MLAPLRGALIAKTQSFFSMGNLSLWCADLLKLFTAAQSDDVIINFGEDSIIARQVDLQLLRDSYWAGLSLLCAAIMLRLGAGSTFLTIAGVFQLVVRPSFHPFFCHFAPFPFFLLPVF